MAKRKVPVHEQLKKKLIRSFQDYELDARLPSDRALAEELGVAYLTISHVMRELEWEGYVKRLPRKGTYLASRERLVRTDQDTGVGADRIVLFAYPNWFSYASWSRLHRSEELCVKRGLGLVEYKMNPDTTYAALKRMIARRDNICGVCLLPIPESIDRQTFSMLDDLGVPIVLFTASELVMGGANIATVSADWSKIGYLQVKTLLDYGHDKLAYVRHEPESLERRNLLAGMKQALRDYGRRQRDMTLIGDWTQPWEMSIEIGYQRVTNMIKNGVKATGLMFDSFAGVTGASRALWEAGLRIPDDLSIITNGTEHVQEDYFAPPLSRVEIHSAEEVQMAFDWMLDEDRRAGIAMTVDPQLVERESIGPPKA